MIIELSEACAEETDLFGFLLDYFGTVFELKCDVRVIPWFSSRMVRESFKQFLLHCRDHC
ncbi:unnamed protein product [Acanthoscelides obtectus]|uniref:Uncharacterized protein n=1 Tax=Acanthoscelides obtectus TaxID=200917 RepID=A0A9P0JJB2_ACAOB|nr:unnamed protein product [Acanthoscelides obtectus]CAK1639744.1 hypothetical protein AOBTE_LOCUS11350 [Acanthoscelides obtectus]